MLSVKCQTGPHCWGLTQVLLRFRDNFLERNYETCPHMEKNHYKRTYELTMYMQWCVTDFFCTLILYNVLLVNFCRFVLAISNDVLTFRII